MLKEWTRTTDVDTDQPEYTTEVTHRVVARLERELKVAGAGSRVRLPSHALANQIAIARVLWRFQAFFDLPPHLLLNDSAQSERYLELQRIAIGALQDVFEELIEQGHMRPANPSGTLGLSRTCWLVWLGWLRAEYRANPAALEPGIPALSRGLALIVTVWSPYFETDLRDLMKTELANIVTR